MRSTKNKGFTLIELLVVISIIGFLSSIVLASLNVARSKARDSLNLQNAKELQKAVQAYYAQNGYYPHQDGSVPSGQAFYRYGIANGTVPGSDATSPGSFNLKSILSNYISSLPMPAVNGQVLVYVAGGSTFSYGCGSSSGDSPKPYVIAFSLENNNLNLPQVEAWMGASYVPAPSYYSGLYCISD